MNLTVVAILEQENNFNLNQTDEDKTYMDYGISSSKQESK